MGKIYRESPYYDDYEPSKEYTQIIALPGRAEQAREFTQAQTIQRDFIERLGSAVFTDGSIISGCELLISDNKHVATIKPGRIFLEGLVRDVKEVQVDILGVGIEHIVVSLNTSIITELEDATLRDPAQGYENFGNVGAYRQKQSLEFFSIVDGDNSREGVTVFTINDGALLRTADSGTEGNIFEDMLAERTYDENGNFKISGLDLQSEVTYDADTDKLNVFVSSGKAYVHGYEIDRSTVSRIAITPSTETRLVQGESHIYSSTLAKYELSNFPVHNVVSLVCPIQVTEATKTRGPVKGGYDGLMYTPVNVEYGIISITQAGGVSYRKNIDYKLYNDQIDWSYAGDNVREPSVGSTYSVTYVYNKAMVAGVDYEVVNEKDKSYIVFKEGGDKPLDNAPFQIYYNYTLARRDLILMDSRGTLSAIEGTSDKFDRLITPYNRDREKLNIGYVDILPMTEGVANYGTVYNYSSVRFTQANLYSLLKRIENLENNMASMDLDREAENGETLSTLNCIFTDNFTDLTKVDVNYLDGNSVKFDCCIDYDSQEMTIPADISDTLVPIDSASSSLGIIGDVISAPFEYQLALEQKNVTGIMKVNPYDAFSPLSVVSLNPSVDKWVDTRTLKYYDTVEKEYYTTTTRTYSKGYWGWHANTVSETTTYLGTTSSTTSTSKVASSLIEYMRPIDVNVNGKAFDNGLTDIECFFNGEHVDLVATGSTVQRPQGKVNADGLGTFTAKFRVPERVPCGTVGVELIGTNALGEVSKGHATYEASGTLLTTTITNTTTLTRNYNVLKEITNYYNTDPLAQSFLFSQDTVIAKIGLYFATKDSSRPCVVQVRNIVNGYPGQTVYAEVTLSADSVNVSSDGSVVTEVVLNQPVYCYADTAYCFVVISDCQSYTMYYAELGKAMYNSPKSYMTVNPYPTGVMFSSSNATTWTAHQGSDLKFKLYKTRYTGVGEIVFQSVKLDSPVISGLVLDASYEDYRNAGITWMYRISSNAEWLPIDSLVYRDLMSTTDTIQLKAKLAVKYNTSPFVSASQVSLKYFMDSKKATYISKTLGSDSFESKYQALKVSYQLSLPSGAYCRVYYKDNELGDWILLDATDEFTKLDTRLIDANEGWYQYTWEVSKIDCLKKSLSSGGSKFYKLRIDLETPIVYNRPRVRKLISIMKINDEYVNEFS